MHPSFLFVDANFQTTLVFFFFSLEFIPHPRAGGLLLEENVCVGGGSRGGGEEL